MLIKTESFSFRCCLQEYQIIIRHPYITVNYKNVVFPLFSNVTTAINYTLIK